MDNGKGRTINVRVTDYQYEKLHKEAYGSGMEFSAYIRHKLSGNYKESERIEYEGKVYKENLTKNQINRKLIELNYHTEQVVKCNKKNHARFMQQIMEELWQLLN